MKIDELNAVGAIFTLIIGTGVYFKDNYIQNKTIQQIQSNYYEAKRLVVQLDSEHKETQLMVQDLTRAYDSMRDDMQEVHTFIHIKDNLRGYTVEEKAIGLAIAWTESTWNFNAKHKSDAEGICGVIPEYWEEYLNSKNIDVNSVAACIEIYKFYKEENNGSKEKALKDYKGIKNNTYLIGKTLRLRDKILKILKESR
jgi:hypothetical protein